MIRGGKFAVLLCVWVCVQAYPAWGCRYNVRDVGFVELGAESYHLYGYVNQSTPNDIANKFEEISRARLADSNIKFELINADLQKGHSAIKHLESQAVESFPAAVLVSGEGLRLGVPVSIPGQRFDESLTTALEEVLSSPKRNEIAEHVVKAYGVVLLIEGLKSQENQNAQSAALGAIEKIAAVMKTMPKPLKEPPVLIVIERQLFAQEKILLWSLGLDASKETGPHVVVVYGRARLIGPVLAGDLITENRLANILAVIGADCECGLDRKWMQGITLPAKWDETIQAQVASELGFDPESPLVKIEISQILGRGVEAGSGFIDLDSFPTVSYEGKELAVELGSAANAPDIEANDKVIASESGSPASPSASNKLALKKLLLIIGGVTMLVIAFGLIIVFKAVRRIS